jgi:hypothetical protein
MTHIDGGRVRYSADAERAFVSVCHGEDCRKFSGSTRGGFSFSQSERL